MQDNIQKTQNFNLNIFNFFILPFKISKSYFFIKAFQILFEGFYPLMEVYAFTNLVSQVLLFPKTQSNKVSAISAILIFFSLLFLQYLVSILISRLSLKPIKKINIFLEKILIEKNLDLEYYYIEDSKLYDKINLCQKQIFNDFIQKHNKLCSIFRIALQLISITIIIYQSIGIKTLFILSAIICVYFISNYNGKKSYEQKKEDSMLDRKAEYYSSVLCDPDFAEERILYNYSEHFNNKYLKAITELIKHEKITKLKNTLRMESSSFLALLVLIYFIIELSSQVKLGIISIGFLIAIIKQLSNFLNIIRWDLFSILEIKSNLANYLKEFNEFQNFEKNKDGTKEISKIDSIEIKNLSFAYPNTDKIILHDLNFKFKQGKSYAIVGENGCGKSTLVKLLLNLYKNYSGEILVNDATNIKNISKESKANCFAVAFQNYGKYYLTLQENIKLGNFNADNEKLKNAINLFSLQEINKNAILRKGDEKSIDLSGGQWQNIALARNYISQANFVIFDEPTSALSPKQESKIYTFLKELTKNKTSIFISHRLGICPIVDEIIVLEKGKIVENATHKKLIQKNGIYAKMYNTQKELYTEN